MSDIETNRESNGFPGATNHTPYDVHYLVKSTSKNFEPNGEAPLDIVVASKIGEAVFRLLPIDLSSSDEAGVFVRRTDPLSDNMIPVNDRSTAVIYSDDNTKFPYAKYHSAREESPASGLTPGEVVAIISYNDGVINVKRTGNTNVGYIGREPSGYDVFDDAHDDVFCGEPQDNTSHLE